MEEAGFTSSSEVCTPVCSLRHSLRRSGSGLDDSSAYRKVCKFGTTCKRRNPDHFAEESHPHDDDYLKCCQAGKVEPEFISIYQIFEYCDTDGSGLAHREELAKAWPLIKKRGQTQFDQITDEIWRKLDDDGNGFVNFSEFSSFIQEFKILDLPLGLDRSRIARSSTALFKTDGPLRCGVKDCSCLQFVPRRARCRFGAQCYQKKPEHRQTFCHPDDADWATCTEVLDRQMCVCGHKECMHAAGSSHAGSVQTPSYWTSAWNGHDELCELVLLGAERAADSATLTRLQELVDKTYDDVTTRDRYRHNGNDWRVPRNFKVSSAFRNENSKVWRKYLYKKANLIHEKKLEEDNPEEARRLNLPAFGDHSDVKTTLAWEASNAADVLDKSINEWYLWHGTSKKNAAEICMNDFKISLSGTATGTLYGRGSYLAESITKADEYARCDGGSYTVLLCRVLGGRVLYTDERTPDPEKLTKACTEGAYDCVIGDRRKISGTYREFIIFDTENVYPEYIVTYERGELFKSPSCP